jgi:hypothetical protein
MCCFMYLVCVCVCVCVRARACVRVCSVLVIILRHTVAQVVEELRYKPEVGVSIPDGVRPAALGHWSRLSL